MPTLANMKNYCHPDKSYEIIKFGNLSFFHLLFFCHKSHLSQQSAPQAIKEHSEKDSQPSWSPEASVPRQNPSLSSCQPSQDAHIRKKMPLQPSQYSLYCTTSSHPFCRSQRMINDQAAGNS